MSKLKSVLVAVVFLSVLMVTPAFSDVLGGCKTGLFIGSYTTLATFTDLWGDGSNVVNSTILQLNLHIDGTVTEVFSGAPDIMLSFGTETPRVGSWKCRSDGKLVVTLINMGDLQSHKRFAEPPDVHGNPPAGGSFARSQYESYIPVFGDRREYLDENQGQIENILSDG